MRDMHSWCQFYNGYWGSKKSADSPIPELSVCENVAVSASAAEYIHHCCYRPWYSGLATIAGALFINYAEREELSMNNSQK